MASEQSSLGQALLSLSATCGVFSVHLCAICSSLGYNLSENEKKDALKKLDLGDGNQLCNSEDGRVNGLILYEC
jgi:hypothetical protein